VVFSYPDKTGKEIVKTTYFNVQCPLGGSQVFVRYNRKVVPCERLRKPDPGTDGEQPVSVVALDQAIASATAAGLTYPTVLYEVTLLNGQRRWVLREELAILRGRYKRGRRINITNAQEQLTIKKTNGDIVQVDVAGLLTTRAAGMLDEVLPPPGSNPQCGSFPPLGCNEIEQQQQQQSLAQILNEMAQLNALTLNYPVRLVLVRLCDGSTMYMLESMLTILEGPYLVLGSLDVNSPSQLFSGTVTENRDPIFAMTFPLFEPNGDIVRANWQVAYRHPQFYIYSYDALDRLTSGRYGEIVSEERQTANGFPFITRYDSYTDIYSVPNIQYDGAGNITSLQRMGRLNDNCGAGQIDALTYTYTEAPRLANVVDSAPDPGRPKGFRPGSVGRADYGYDYNGNLTSDPNKNLTIQYNFLNLPKMVNATPVVYDAAGRKWRWGSGPTARETFNGIDFVEGKLEGFLHDKGRIAPERNEFGGIARLRAEYWRQDHLGNTRVAFSDQNGDGFITTRDNPATPENDVEIMQENHYYPFGMNHDGRWFGPQDPENRYTYNGKEYNPELGLDWYDYGARWYDAALGRFTGIDLFAEKYTSLASYHYCSNNPVR
jgi:RHS repeat-associated protein